jgi:BirA family biotin operon repressor/biotin-[acetyl-CoA-carboxylase] ligase
MKPVSLIELAETTSTNDALAALARQGAVEGTAVVARAQTRGRGRQRRPWHSPPGLGLYLSVLLRPPWPAAESGALALLGGIAVVTALERLGVKDLALKWPNDVLAGGKKICGVLVEPALHGDKIEFAVVGIGINVLQRHEDFPPELRGTATSCRLAGVKGTVAQVRDAVLAALMACYQQALRDGPNSLYAVWVEKNGGVKDDAGRQTA